MAVYEGTGTPTNTTLPEGSLYYNYSNAGLYEKLSSGWVEIASSTSSSSYFNNVVNSSQYSITAGGFPLTATGTQYQVVGTNPNPTGVDSTLNNGTALYEANASGAWTLVGVIAPLTTGVP